VPSTPIRQLIQHSYLKSLLIPLLVILPTLLIMYFAVIFMITQNSKALALRQAIENLQIITEQQADSLDANIREAMRDGGIAQHQITSQFIHLNEPVSDVVKQQFGFHDNGAFYKLNPGQDSSLYYSTFFGQPNLQKAYWSERLNPLLKGITETNPLIVQSYFNSWDSMVRLYPPLPNAPDVFGPKADISQQPFYYLGDEKHDKAHNVVLTPSYFDPLGMGWIISALAPVYSNNKLQGVAGFDVSIARLAQKVLDPKLPWHASSLLLSPKGEILAIDPNFNHRLGVKVVKGQQYPELLNKELARKDQFNLLSFTDSSLQSSFVDFMQSQASSKKIDIDGRHYLILHATAKETGWQIMAMVDESNLYADALSTEAFTKHIGYLTLAALFLMALLFAYLSSLRIQRLSLRIANPIQTLSEQTSRIETGKTVQLVKSGVTEIDQLQDNFQKMVHQLDQRRQSLLEIQVEHRVQQERANLLKELSETDSLTGLANRRKLDDILASEIGRANRYESPLSLILLDIDHFKQINDTLGHLAGDEVICHIAQLLKSNTRDTDVVGRWGGEEFLLICPGIDLISAEQLAEKLRQDLAQQPVKKGLQITASFGVTLFQQGDNVDTLLSRVDNALYQSKRQGRNRVNTTEHSS